MVTTRAALRARTGDRSGLTIERFFTTPGVHPYDVLAWELRDAVVKDHKAGTAGSSSATWSSPPAGR